MADYSIWVLGESSISLSDGAQLDGITQGDGSHLLGHTLTINNAQGAEVQVSDGGSDTSFEDNDGGQRLDGEQTIDGVTYSSGTRIEAEFQFTVEDPDTGIQYQVIGVNVVQDGSYGTIEGLAFVDAAPPVGVELTIVSTSEGPRGSVDESQIVAICLTKGTRIRTAGGETLIEDLRVGDQVAVFEGGHSELRLVSREVFSDADLAENPKLRPIRITAGALGDGLPTRDLLVSRNHRMLVVSKIAERMFGKSKVLVPAKQLTVLPGIYSEDAADGVEYFHLAFDRHQVIFAEGAPTESLFPGREALRSLPSDVREELLTIFPKLSVQAAVIEPAFPIPSSKQQKNLIARLVENGKPPLG